MPVVQVENLEINYEVKGEGEPLVFLHGLGNNSQSFTNQLEGLSDSFTVIAWDAPGYGKSSNPEELLKDFSEFSKVLNGLLEQLNYDSVYLLGHSMGAAVAVDFAYNYPQKVKKLILADATRGSASISKEKNEENLQNRIKNVEQLSGEELADKRVPNLLADDVSEIVMENAKAIMAQVRPSGYKSVAYSLFNLNQMDIYPKLVMDALLICGEEDRVTPVRESKIIADLIPNSRLETIANAGHLCYQEKPQIFNELVRNFLVNKK